MIKHFKGQRFCRSDVVEVYVPTTVITTEVGTGTGSTVDMDDTGLKNSILGIAIGLPVLVTVLSVAVAITAVLLGTRGFGRRGRKGENSDRDGAPRSMAFFQAVRAPAPTNLSGHDKRIRLWIADTSRPRPEKYQINRQYNSAIYAPRYVSHSIPVSKIPAASHSFDGRRHYQS